MATKNLVPRSNNEGKLGTGAKKWAAVNAYKLYGNLQIQELNSATNTESTDLLMIYDQSNSEPRKISVADLNLGSGLGIIDVRPHELVDDTDTACDRDSAFGIYATVDFPNTSDGSIWYSFKFPTSWSTEKDINLELAYTLSGSDPDKIIKMITQAWLVSEGDQPDSNAPNTSNSDNITTDSDNIGRYAEVTLNNGSISSSNIPSTTTSVVLKLTRDVSDDTYTGIAQLLGLRISQ